MCVCVLCLATRDAETCAQPVPAGWNYYPYKSFPGSDLGSSGITSGNWTLLAEVCDSPWCASHHFDGSLYHGRCAEHF